MLPPAAQERESSSMDERGWNTGAQPPVNQPESPFEEPEQAPELRQARSENLYSRDEPFWNRVVEQQTGRQPVRDANYWNHPDVMDSDTLLHVDSDTKLQKVKKFLGSGATKKFLLIVAIVTAVGAILYSALFQVRRIVVLGNTTIPGQDIVRLSGLKIGQNSLTIDDENVMRRIESNRYLRCTLVDVQWDSVTIHIKERVPAVYLHYNGLLIVMDNRGFVLEESLEHETAYQGLVHVIGMNVRRSALGQTIAVTNKAQLETLTQVLVELKAMKGIDLLRELDMTSMDSIYLATRDGFDVRLGSEDSIHEKLRAFLITRERVIGMGHTTGTIDVTDPGRPTYSPD